MAAKRTTTRRETSMKKTTAKAATATKKAAGKSSVKKDATKKSAVKETTARRASTRRAPARRGDLIVVDSTRVGSAPREGEILKVMAGDVSVSYEVRWGDGHQSLITPAAGTAHIVSK